jgi:tetratricopeptide (TPR) repeat protein
MNYSIGVLGMAVFLSGCGGWKEKAKQVDELRNRAALHYDLQQEKRKKTDGLITVTRKGKNYDIQLQFDASDENVYFYMDIPQEGQKEATLTVPEFPMEERDPEENFAEEVIEQAEALEDEDSVPQAEEADNATKHMLYAQTYLYEKKYGRALDEINQVLAIVPKSSVGHALKGSIYYKLGDVDQARSAWEYALRIDPNMENVRNSLNRVKEAAL